MTDNKTRIREKAKELFMLWGLRSVSMDDIAAAAGMSKKTIYQYYDNKQILASDVIDLILAENKATCEQCRLKAKNAIHEGFLITKSVSETMKKVNPIILYDMQKYFPNAYKKYMKFKGDFLYKFTYSSIEWGVKDGLFRADVDISLASLISLLRIENINPPIQRSFYDTFKKDLASLQEEIFILFLYGMATAKGIRLINKYGTEQIKSITDDTN